jgi:glycosyltransferase involved in cell wall biosynthesis
MNKELQTSSTKPLVSVIIPVYNDAGCLQRCLDVLDKQTYRQNLYEVSVVDNGSDQKIDAAVNKYRQVVLQYEKRPGSYAARNKGIVFAKGEIIAFTDSDCIPSRNWIRNGVARFQNHPTCGMVAGKISLFFKDPKKLNAVEVYEKFNAFKQKNKVEKYNHGVTANFFSLKRVFDKEGLFNDKLKSGGDVEWCQRIHSKGYELMYANDVCVAHPARNTFSQLYQKTTRVVGGIHDWNGSENPYSLLKILHDFYNLIKHLVWLMMALVLKLPYFNKFKSIRQKLQYICVVAFVGSIRIFEKTRLRLGGKSER